VLGVIGHVDHGKSALVRALTGAQTDRLIEEQTRGISIALGFAHLSVAAHTEIDLIDMPGHERFVRTMISGATGIDAVLLVVAANEGLKPQTLEHVNIASLLGLPRALLVISKCDLVEPAQAQHVAHEAVQLLRRCGLEPLPAVMTSALRGEGLDEVRAALRMLAENQQPRTADGLPFLPVDRAFSVAGHGPVVTGTLRGAALAPGATLELFPSRRKVRVRAVQVHRSAVSEARPGQRVAVNLRDVEVAELARGMVLAAPDTLTPSNWLTIALRMVEGAPPLRNGARLRALLGTDELDVCLRLLDADVLEPGQSGMAQLRCLTAVAVPAGEHVILRLPSPAQTVAGGRVLEAVARRQRRGCARTLQRLRDLRELAADGIVAAEVQRAGLAGTTVRYLSQLTALALPSILQLLQGLPFVVTQSGRVVRQADLDELVGRISALLAPQSTGLSHEQLLSAMPGVGAAVLDEALARLLARGAIAKRGNQFRVPRPQQDLAQARSDFALAARIAETLRRAGLTPPSPGEIVTSVQSKRAVERLLREGVVVRAVDRAKGREILFHREAIEAAQRCLAPLLERVPGLLVTEVGAALGISRKYSMPLLDHLDTIRFTRRIQDRRVRHTN
jgi:selenocysteine-specific elongation factor